MKRLFVEMYEYKDGLHENDLRDMTKAFTEMGTAAGVIAHYERLDGRGGFLIEEVPEDSEKNYELTIRYSRWVNFQVFPVTTMEDAFPVIQRIYG